MDRYYTGATRTATTVTVYFGVWKQWTANQWTDQQPIFGNDLKYQSKNLLLAKIFQKNISRSIPSLFHPISIMMILFRLAVDRIEQSMRKAPHAYLYTVCEHESNVVENLLVAAVLQTVQPGSINQSINHPLKQVILIKKRMYEWGRRGKQKKRG